MTVAGILHADLDAFYASVEQRDDPALRGRPVIVGAGVVLAASYEARGCGVRTAMGGRAARRLCPDAVVVEPRLRAYIEASRAVFAEFRATTPIVEGLSIDEAFLDVRGLGRIAGPPAAIAADLRARVRGNVGLPITVGVARTKFLAKVASGVAKPDGLLVVEPDDEETFLLPLPVTRLWGVGPVTERRLERLGLATVADVAAVGEAALVSLLGPAQGRHLHALTHRRDPRPVTPRRHRGSVGAQRALGRGVASRSTVAAVLHGLVDRVGRRLRHNELVGRTVVLRLRFADYTRATRSHTMPEPADDTHTIAATALGLLDDAWGLVEARGITLVGVSVANVSPARAVQLTLPLDGRDRRHLDAALDAIDRRFGHRGVSRASLLHLGPGIEAPQLPAEPE